jgi:hypothetical protein
MVTNALRFLIGALRVLVLVGTNSPSPRFKAGRMIVLMLLAVATVQMHFVMGPIVMFVGCSFLCCCPDLWQ